MNILFICDEYPPGRNGGIGTSVQTLSRQLVKSGHTVFVAGLYSYKYGQANREDDLGVKVYRERYGLNLHVKEESKAYNLIDKLPDFIKQNLNGKKAFNKFIDFIHNLIDEKKIDVVEIADYNNFCQHIGFIVSWPTFKVPLVLKSHGSHTYSRHELNIEPDKKLKATDLLLFKRADAYASVSDYTAKKNKLLFPIQKNVKILYNGIDMSSTLTTVTKDENTVMYTGSLTRQKGIFSLITAWNSVYEQLPEVKLLIFGKGKTAELKAILNDSAKNSVSFMGHVNRPVLLDRLSKATLAVFPSYTETFGLGVVEAMSVRCPVIFTKRSCGPEIVRPNSDGLLVDPDNITEIASCILELLKNNKEREQLAATAFESVKLKFDIEKLAIQHIAFYKEVISDFNSNERPDK